MRWKLSVGALALILAVATFASRAPAALNCNTQQCVEIGFVADANGVNTKCTYSGTFNYAYSAVFASIRYGQDSKGGAAGTPVAGNYRRCNATNDCAAQMVTPSSGVVTMITGTPSNLMFNTKCAGT